MEGYVAGLLDEEEQAEVKRMSLLFSEVKDELEMIGISLESYAKEQAIKPSTTVKALLMAAVDFTERLKAGEEVIDPPILNERSVILDFLYWLQQPVFQLPERFDGLYARLINAKPAYSTAVVWIKEMAAEEVHHDEYEKFLIVEGSCVVTIDHQEFKLYPGDYISIPLYKNHSLRVTSTIPCKAILQRIAA